MGTSIGQIANSIKPYVVGWINDSVEGTGTTRVSITDHGLLSGLRDDDHQLYYNVFHATRFGATGDGTTDDTLALQNAIDEANLAGGGTVFFEPGTYITSSALTLYSNIILLGAGWGTALKMANSSNVIQMITASGQNNIIVSDIQLNGNKANQSDNFLHGIRMADCKRVIVNRVFAHNFKGIAAAGSEGTGIRLRGAVGTYNADSIIFGCITASNGGVGIGCYRTGGVIYANCLSYENDSMGLSFSSDEVSNFGNVIVGCHSRNNIQAGVNLEYQGEATVLGVAVKNHDSASALGGIRIADSRRIVVSSFTSHDDLYGVRFASTTGSDPWSININGGHIWSPTTDGIFIRGGTTSTCPGKASLSNVVIRKSDGDGIDIQNNVGTVNITGGEIWSSSSVGIRVSASAETTINGVSILDNTGNGIRVDSASGTINITGNTIKRNGGHGIYVQDIADGGVIGNNVCSENGQSASNTYDGIFVTSSSHIAITGNSCVDNSASPTQRSGIREAGTSDWNTIVGNIARGNVGANQIATVGAGTKTAHNIGSTTHNT